MEIFLEQITYSEFQDLFIGLNISWKGSFIMICDFLFHKYFDAEKIFMDGGLVNNLASGVPFEIIFNRQMQVVEISLTMKGFKQSCVKLLVLG